MPDLSRYDDWFAWLTERSQADPDVLVTWIGGSAVTGGWDDWSDIDVVTVCRESTSTAVYRRWVQAIRDEWTPPSVWEVPGGWQCFVPMQVRPGLLDEPTRLVDLVVVDVTENHHVMDVRRHGSPIVLHDPEGLVVLRDDDPVELAQGMAEAVDQVRQKRPTSEWLVNRAIDRGHVAEALDLYVRHGLQLLVRLLRAEHCPERHDYGLRYLRDDLPVDVVDRFEALVPGHATKPMRELSAECFAWIDELLTA